MDNKNEVIEVIRLLLKGYNHSEGKNEHFLHSKVNGKDYYLWSCKYLLNQVLRQYNVPDERCYYSEGAKKLWESLGYEVRDLKKMYYREHIICKKDNVECQRYSGSNGESNSLLLKNGDSFVFNDVFHLEHMIPISHIIKQLQGLGDNPTDEKIIAVLEQICVARITKAEDRDLHNKNKRGSTFDDVYKNLYINKGIVLYDNSDKQVEVK